tara:strand:+ start:736 stop:1830 length:1095 start_codon:yes stop_codon:yes gene_type:complete
MKNLIYITVLSLLIACSQNTEQVEQVEAAGLIQLTSEQLAFNEIQTGAMPKGPIYHKVRATGQVDIPPNYSVKISSPTEAYVTQLKVLPGQRVVRGQLLARLKHLSIAEIQKTYLTALAELNYVRKDLARKQGLIDGNTVSAREYERLQSEEQSKTANLKSIESELVRLGIEFDNLTSETVTQTLDVRAPISGVVTDLFSQTGQFAAPNDPLLTISSRDHEHVELEVFQEDLVKIREGMEVWMRLPGQEKIYSGEIFLTNIQLDKETLSGNVHVHVGEDFPELPIGAVVFGEIIYQVDSGYVMPRSEVIREGTNHFIFTSSHEGYKKQQVEIGFDDGVNVNIKGPQEMLGTEVVLKGNYYLNGI